MKIQFVHKQDVETERVNHWNPRLNNLIFQPLKVVSRYLDPQPQVGEKNSYLFNFRPKHLQNLMFKHGFLSQ